MTADQIDKLEKFIRAIVMEMKPESDCQDAVNVIQARQELLESFE